MRDFYLTMGAPPEIPMGGWYMKTDGLRIINTALNHTGRYFLRRLEILGIVLVFLVVGRLIASLIGYPLYGVSELVMEASWGGILKAVIYSIVGILIGIYFILLILDRRIRRVLNYLYGFTVFVVVVLFAVAVLILAIYLPLPINLFYYKTIHIDSVFRIVVSVILVGALGFSIGWRIRQRVIQGKTKPFQIIAALFPIWLRIPLYILAIMIGFPLLVLAWWNMPWLAIPLTLIGILVVLILFNWKNWAASHTK
jgi:hypothetical protein